MRPTQAAGWRLSYRRVSDGGCLLPGTGQSANDPIADISDKSHTEHMRWLAFAILMLVSGCSRVPNSFVVEDQNRAVASAKLVLCGSETPFERTGDRLVVSKRIECEGSGLVRLRYASGEEHECVVGYVTPGAVQDFTFRATKNGCA